VRACGKHVLQIALVESTKEMTPCFSEKRDHICFDAQGLNYIQTHTQTKKQTHACSPIMVLMPWCLNLILFLFSLSFGKSLGT